MPPTNRDHEDATRRYYDEFAERYDDQRDGKVGGGYHDLVDDLEMGFLEPIARGKDVLEIGCGTGVLLARIARFAKSAKGVDLSPAMLERAALRGVDVTLGSASELPFEDASFDVVCSFKVLAHVKGVERALSEMLRVTRPRGILVAEFYNPWSLRALVKRIGPAGLISAKTTEDAVYTRYDTRVDVERMLGAAGRIEAVRGVRIVTPTARALAVPVLGALLKAAERRLCDGPLSRFGGFWIAAIRKA